MTKKEKINRNIGLTFDFLRQVVDNPSLVDKINDNSTLEFVEKDFVHIEKTTVNEDRKYLKVVSHLEAL